MKRLVLLVAVLGFACLFTGTAFADILNVPAEYSTIQAGIDAASPGDTVQVAAGTYNENITMKSGVVIQGAGQGLSIIDGGESGSVVTANGVNSAAKLDGFTITKGKAIQGGGMYSLNSSPTVSNCSFLNNSASIVIGAGGGWRDVQRKLLTVGNQLYFFRKRCIWCIRRRDVQRKFLAYGDRLHFFRKHILPSRRRNGQR